VSLTLHNTVTPSNICCPIMYKVPVGALILVTHLCLFSYKTRPIICHLFTTWRPRNLQAIPHSIRPRSFPEPHPSFSRNIPLCVRSCHRLSPLILSGHPDAADLRYPVVTALLHLHAFLLLPLFHHLWIGTGTGNANFFYASTLVFGLANGGALLDCVWAGLRVAIGEEKDGWIVTQE
jgi:hypothetical protein